MATNLVSTEQDNTKPWTINEEYKFFPKREGDPWQRVLEPILDKEKIRCDGWKDEIANLLIFAGLFSGVVTAFIIESYKTLQPDRNDDIVGLLSQISIQLGNSSEPSLSGLPSQSFIASRTAIRVNIFWFLSLIFSLTTVLIGIVALQWLREYQAYPGQSSQEMMALHHMRSEGMQRWHVWKILTALPLLLQMALVLFLVGIIDFLGALGSKAVVASATVVVALTLLFLFATTILPSVQVVFLRLLLISPFQFDKPPSPCPYKSPQSHLFHSFSAACPLALASLCLALWYPFQRLLGAYRSQRFTRFLAKPVREPLTKNNLPVRYYLIELWSKKTWIDFDSTWLWVRDACSRGLYDKDFNSKGPEISWDLSPITALFDVMAVICRIEAGVDSNKYLDMYLCFNDLSKMFTIFNTKQRSLRASNLSILWQRNIYLRSLIPISPYAKDDDLVEYLKPDTRRWSDDFTPSSNSIKALHDMDIYRFLMRSSFDPQSQLFLHQQEIAIRLQNYLFGKKTIHPPQVNLPLYLHFGRWMSIETPQRAAVSHQQILSVTTFFDYLCRPGVAIAPEDIHGHRDIALALRLGGRTFSWMAAQPASVQMEGYAKINDALVRLLDHLAGALTTMYNKESPQANMLYVAHYAAIFLRPFGLAFKDHPEQSQSSRISQSYAKVMSAIHVYSNYPVNSSNPALAALSSLLASLSDGSGSDNNLAGLLPVQSIKSFDAVVAFTEINSDDRPPKLMDV